jgi:tetratricopeptide (TPR) repeat protein
MYLFKFIKGYEEQDQIDLAKEDYEKLISIKNDHHKAHYNLGRIYYKEKRFEDAINCFNVYIKNDNNEFNAFFNRGMCKYIHLI